MSENSISEETVEETLAERGKTYGDFGEGCRAWAGLMEIAVGNYRREHGVEMPEIDRVHIGYVCMKLLRLFISPRHEDTWHDISGYSRLIEIDCKEINDADKQKCTLSTVSCECEAKRRAED